MNRIVTKIIFLSTIFTLSMQAKNSNVAAIQDPLDVVQLIGDKLIRETPFTYKLELSNCEKEFNKMYFVNFGRTLSTEKPAVAYAYTLLETPKDLVMDIDLEHNDACKIWLNNTLVYEKKGIRNISMKYDERSLEMSFKTALNLKKGINTLLIKSETASGKDWCFLMQPPATKGAVLCEKQDYPRFVLEKTNNLDAKITTLTNWLVIGPFEKDIDKTYPPENVLEFGKMYAGLNG